MLCVRQNMLEVVTCSSWQKVLRNKCGNNCCGINKIVCGINTLKTIVKKIGNYTPNEKRIASLCLEKLKRLTMKT